MNETLFSRAFKIINEKAKDSFEVIGDVLIVEEVPREEVKTKSGLVLATGDNKISQMNGLEANRPIFCRVLAVGEGYFNDKGETVPLDTKVNDIIMVGRMSVSWLSYFGPLISTAQSQIGYCRESEIKLKYKGQEGYQKVVNLLSELNAERDIGNG